MTTSNTTELREGAEQRAAEANRPQGSPQEAAAEPRLPEGCIPVLPLRNTVLFPSTVLPLEVGRPKSVAAVQYAVKTQSLVGVILQRDAD